MRQVLKEMVVRCGLAGREKEPAILFLGQSREAFAAVAPVLEHFQQNRQRVKSVLCARDTALRTWLSERFSNATVVPPPYDLAGSSALFLSTLKIRTAVVLEQTAPLAKGLAASLYKRATPLVVMSGRRIDYLDLQDQSVLKPELLLVAGEKTKPASATAEKLQFLSSRDGCLDNVGTDEAIRLLLPLVGRDRKWNERSDRQLGRWFGEKLFQMIETPRWRSYLLRGRIERYDTLEALKERLGRPETILCLGNGPSSEDPRLKDMAFDTLFRANHSWKSRGFLTEPDVVFTGVQASMRAVRTTILGVLGEETEKVLLMVRGFTPLYGPLQYVVVDKLNRFPDGSNWGDYRPTSGAIMLASAVALAPKRLLVAGMDMFQHSQGTYPGDTVTPNAYTPAHTFDKELAFILSHLERFKGEIVIVGDVLEREWTQYRDRMRRADPPTEAEQRS